MIKSFIARNIYEPLYVQFYRKDNRFKYYNFYKKSQWNTLEQNKKIQAKNLYELIKYASENIPYYKKVVKQNKINLSENTIFEDIKKFPILTKNILRKEFHYLHKFQKGVKWYYNTSGGSTGKPVRLIQDYDYGSRSSAMVKIQNEWAGCRYGDKLIQLWGSEKDILQQKEKMHHRFASWIKSIYLLNSFLMDEKKMQSYIRIINQRRPKMILAYAQSINELAKFIGFNEFKIFSPKSIMTSAGILYPEFRKTIEKVFKCPVFNRYGSREIGNIACECEKHEGLHISIFTHFIEILDKDLEPCKEGETGEIYITLLTNFTMPLVRYKIGDMAKYTEHVCSCGRGLPLIKDVVGRDTDVFKTKDGRIIQGEFFIHFIGVVFNQGEIDKFQVIQEEYNLIKIKVVIKDEIKFHKNKVNIEKSIFKIMGKDCEIKWEIVKDIKPTKSGKYRCTIREF